MLIKTTVFTIKLIILTIRQYFFARNLLNKYFTLEIEPRLRNKALLYATVIPNFIVRWYAEMAGLKLKGVRLEQITLIAALTGVNDEFTDKLGNDEDYLNNFFYNFKKVKAKNQHELLQQKILNDILRSALNKEKLWQAFVNIHKAQIASLKQKKEITQQKLAKLIADKGGYSALLCVIAVNPEASIQEQEAIYEAGHWMQLIDDLSDTQKDKREGVYTLLNTMPVAEYQEVLKKQSELVHKKIKALNYSTKKKYQALFSLHYFAEIVLALFERIDEGKHKRKNNVLLEVLSFFGVLGDAYQKLKKIQY